MPKVPRSYSHMTDAEIHNWIAEINLTIKDLRGGENSGQISELHLPAIAGLEAELRFRERDLVREGTPGIDFDNEENL